MRQARLAGIFRYRKFKIVRLCGKDDNCLGEINNNDKTRADRFRNTIFRD